MGMKSFFSHRWMLHFPTAHNQTVQMARADYLDFSFVYRVDKYVFVCIRARTVAILSNLLRLGHDELLQVLVDNVYDFEGKKRTIIISSI